MTDFEKSAIIGYYRNGMSFEAIGKLMGISEAYARIIVIEYFHIKNIQEDIESVNNKLK